MDLSKENRSVLWYARCPVCGKGGKSVSNRNFSSPSIGLELKNKTQEKKRGNVHGEKTKEKIGKENMILEKTFSFIFLSVLFSYFNQM